MLHQNVVQYHGNKPLVFNHSISGPNLGVISTWIKCPPKLDREMLRFLEKNLKSTPEAIYHDIGLHFGATFFSSTPSL